MADIEEVGIKDLHAESSQDFRFAKQQQWIVTNYTVLIYVVISAFKKSIEIPPTHEQYINTILVIFAVMTALIGVCAQWAYLKWIQQSQSKLNRIYERNATKQYSEVMSKWSHPFGLRLTGVIFIVLSAVIVVGCGLTIYAIWYI